MNARPWHEPEPVDVADSLRTVVGGHPLVSETLVRRGITTPVEALGFLDPNLYLQTAASELPGMGRAVSRLGRAIRGGESICVWGDFDVDGQTATALLLSGLRDLSARVIYHIPNREREGHGIALPVLEGIIQGGATVIVTCDTGITALDAVALARHHGVDFVITDHHELPPVIPDATAVVNPRMLTAGHPLNHLPGVGVAYKLAQALYEWARRGGEEARHLDLVSLGIVADLAILRGDTRSLLQRGLVQLRSSERVGLKALFAATEMETSALSEEHIAFVLAPRLNAAGRLADAAPCVELLTTTDRTLAESIAQDLDRLNARRKQLTDDVTRGAEAQIAADRSLLDNGCLVLAGPYWPPGVIGIVASRMVDKYGLPTVVISSPPGDEARGSARSIEGLHITEAIAEHAALLTRFGGHPMAAGITLPADRIADFRRGMGRTVRRRLEGYERRGIQVDAYLPLDALSLELVDDLGRLAPFGPGNPGLTLVATRLRVAPGSRSVGRGNEHRLLRLTDEEDATHSVLWWNGGREEPPEGMIDLAYIARPSSFSGSREVQIELVAVRPSEDGHPVLVNSIEVIDHREDPSPLQTLQAVLAEGDATIWREADAAVTGADREGVGPCVTLVIWTAPPGPSELRAVLAAASPERVHLFAQDPGMDRPEAFERRLAGLVRHVLASGGGTTNVSALAAATAQTPVAVRLGLLRLAQRGLIRVEEQRSSELTFSPGDAIPASSAELTATARHLRAVLEESAAYRKHFRTTDKDLVVR